MATSPPGWLISRRADFWFACAGGSQVLVALAAVLYWWGYRELDAADFLLAELHIGATYEVVWRRRLWRAMPRDVAVVPLLIIATTYALVASGNAYLVSTALMYLAVWHRGRQNLGVGRWYQRAAGGEVSRLHRLLFHGAIFLPMAASVLFYTSSSPNYYEGEPYLSWVAPPVVTWGLGAVALIWTLAYFAWARDKPGVHPAERWSVAAHAVAFGSAYLLGEWNPSFIIVIALHHEVQYLYFTYALARRQNPVMNLRSEIRRLGSFAVWPAVGLATTLACMWANDHLGWEWLAPSFVALLLVHYWLDGRIWTRRAVPSK